MMTKHRIGRVELPWANLEPPIRSPDYYINLEKKKKARRDASAGQAEAAIKPRRGKSVDLGSVGLFPLRPVLSYEHALLVTAAGRTELG